MRPLSLTWQEVGGTAPTWRSRAGLLSSGCSIRALHHWQRLFLSSSEVFFPVLMVTGAGAELPPQTSAGAAGDLVLRT